MITYISYNQLVNDIRDNLWKIPRDTDLVCSVPRSGTVPAGIITKFLNVNMMTIHQFCEIAESNAESIQEELRKYLHKGLAITRDVKIIRNVLLVDDTVYSGNQMMKWLNRLSQDCYKDFNFVFLSVYKEFDVSPGIFLRDISAISKKSVINSVLYEWTLWYRYDLVSRFAFDLDGVLCLDPPDDANTEEYEKYIENPIPYYIPTIPTSAFLTTIITYRLNKYRSQTEKFLKDIGVIGTLYMVGLDTREQRNETITPWDYKASVYGSRDDLVLYIESNDFEAQMIHNITKKPVFCVATNRIYQIED